MKKHPREFYFLIAFTFAASFLIIFLLILGQGFLINFTYPQDVNASVNDTHITFIFTNKHYEKNDSWTVVRGDYYYMNQTDLRNLNFNKEYSCNVTESLIRWLNTTITDCKETIK